MRSKTPADLKGRCPRCYVMSAHCLCAEIPRVDNRTEIVVLRHAFETSKSTNTARTAALALSRLRIIEWETRAPPDVDGLLATLGAVWLLFPGESSIGPSAHRPDALIVLDGTWRQVRKMLKAHPALLRLPKLALPPSTGSVRRLREAPAADARSTLESIAHALSLIEGEAVGAPLERLHALMVDRVLRARGMADRP